MTCTLCHLLFEGNKLIISHVFDVVTEAQINLFFVGSGFFFIKGIFPNDFLRSLRYFFYFVRAKGVKKTAECSKIIQFGQGHFCFDKSEVCSLSRKLKIPSEENSFFWPAKQLKHVKCNFRTPCRIMSKIKTVYIIRLVFFFVKILSLFSHQKTKLFI